MIRFIFPLILIAIAVALFVGFTKPQYQNLRTVRQEMLDLDKALSNAKALQSERDALADLYNSFSARDIDRVEKMVPSSVESIHLIQEIQEIGKKNSIIVKNVDFDPDKVGQGEEGAVQEEVVPTTTRTQRVNAQTNLPYDTYELKFAVQGPYGSFVSFLDMLEKSLRLVDVVEVTFSSNATRKEQFSDVYDYTFTIVTYRLRN